MAHNDTHAARKKGGAGKILLVVLLLLLLAGRNGAVCPQRDPRQQ